MTQPAPLTDEQLTQIEARAQAATPGPWQKHEEYGRYFYANLTGEYLRGVGDFMFGAGAQAEADEEFVRHARTDVDVLLAEVHRLRDELGAATEFRLEPTPPAYTPLIVRRDAAYDGTRWAVLHDPGDLAVRRAWTAEGWEMAWASSHSEIYCWPDAASALAAARQAQAENDREPDVDGAGRTPESYRDRPTPAPAVSGGEQ